MIVSFRNKKNKRIYSLQKDGSYGNKKDKGRDFSAVYGIINPEVEIFSVKDRDGIIHKIGDIFKADLTDTKEKIVGFRPVFTGFYVFGKETTDDINYCTYYN